MNFDIYSHTIFLTRHGSHAYNLALPTSDIDLKGVCIEPLNYHLGFLDNFEQHIQEASKGYPQDLVIYSLKKFAKLAADCNPNIIEVLFADDADIIKTTRTGTLLRDFRQSFLSLKAKHTFAGYAHSQLKRIRTHRSWLLTPPKQPPSRKDYGLSETFKVSKSEMGAYEDLAKNDQLQELSKEALALYSRERQYQTMLTQWNQYQEWKRSRNTARAALEAQFGFDTKHGMHLIRLMRMCKEILTTGKVNVHREDREELLDIRQGRRDYDSVVAEAERLDEECSHLYKTSTVLPHSPDYRRIDEFIVDLTADFLGIPSL